VRPVNESTEDTASTRVRGGRGIEKPSSRQAAATFWLPASGE
jgi:hypothetical protein